MEGKAGFAGAEKYSRINALVQLFHASPQCPAPRKAGLPEDQCYFPFGFLGMAAFDPTFSVLSAAKG